VSGREAEGLFFFRVTATVSQEACFNPPPPPLFEEEEEEWEKEKEGRTEEEEEEEARLRIKAAVSSSSSIAVEEEEGGGQGEGGSMPRRGAVGSMEGEEKGGEERVEGRRGEEDR